MLKDIKILGRESLIYGFSTVFARLLNFFLVPFYTYFLLSPEYGLAAAVFSYIAFFNVVYQIGMDQAYMRFAYDGGDEKEVFSTAFWAVCVFSAGVSLLLISGSNVFAVVSGLGRENGGLVRYAALILALDALSAVPFAKLRLDHRPWLFAGIKTASIVVNITANIVFVGIFKAGVYGVFAASVAGALVSLALLLPEIIRHLRPVFSARLFPGMLRFAWPFVPAGLAAMIVQVADRPILLFLTDAGTAGVYQANYRLGIFMMLTVAMFDQAWRPFFLERARRDDAKTIFSTVFSYFTLGGSWVTLALSLFIGDIVTVSVGGYSLIHPGYWGGLGIVPVVLCGYLFYGFYINFLAAPIISKKTENIVWVTLAGGICNIAANFLLIPRFFMLGAAWATFLSYFIMAALMFRLGRKCYPIDYDLKKAAGVLAAAAACYVLGTELASMSSYYPVAALIKLAVLAAFTFFVVRTGLAEKNERLLVSELKQKFGDS